MSKQAQQDDRWLAGYRYIAAGILLMVMMAMLVRVYQGHRTQAPRVTLDLLGIQFAERVQRLHGRWLDERRPTLLYASGQEWLFDDRGWPLGRQPHQSPSEHCRQLWWSVVGDEAAVKGRLPPLQFLVHPDGSGCDIGWDGTWLVYQFSDGRVTKRFE